MKKIASRFNYPKIVGNLLEGFSLRQKEILKRRFGIKEGKKETLESIGRDFGLTRERVRQIEEVSLNSLEKNKNIYLGRIIGEILDYLNFYGGARKEEDFFLDFGGKNKPFLSLILRVQPRIHYFSTFAELHPFFVSDKKVPLKVKKLNNFLIKKIKIESRVFTGEDLKKINLEEIPEVLKEKISETAFFSFLSISRQILRSPLGEFGLRDWPEINPRGVRDETYLVLKKEGKPLHFLQISEKVSELREELQTSNLPVNHQTVHNELIKDQRFVLVGRGIYGISEWGLKPGRVKDIILEILRRGQAMTKEEIKNEVLKQRLVKENTIFLNLQNKKYFSKNQEGKYTLV